MELEQIKKLEEQVMSLSMLMYRNEEQKAYEKFADTVQPLQTICLNLMQAAQNSLELQEIKLDMIALNALKRMVDCHNRKDILGLADCLRYEMMELINVYVQLAG